MNSVNNEATHTNLKSSEEATKGKSSRNNERRGLIKPGYEYNPVVKYLGFSLLLSYHYVLWFNPESFYPIPLLDEKITIGWLVNHKNARQSCSTRTYSNYLSIRIHRA